MNTGQDERAAAKRCSALKGVSHKDHCAPFVPAWPDERIGTKATETPADFNTQLARRHERRWARGRTITDAGHVVIPDDLHRNLSDYDTAFGVTMDTQVSA